MVADAAAPLSRFVAAPPVGGFAAGARPAASSEEVAAPSLEVELTSLEPAVVTDGAVVTVSGRVTNRLEGAVAGVDLALQLQTAAATTAPGLYQFLSTGEVEAGIDRLVGVLPLPTPLAPGESTEFTLRVPTSELPLWGQEEWGPRGLTVAAYGLSHTPTASGTLEQRWPDDPDEDGPDGWKRTLLVWNSGISAPTVRVGVLAPLTPTATELATALSSGVPVAGVSAPRAAALAPAGSLPGVTLAVDPMLLQQDNKTTQFLRADASPISALDAAGRTAPSPPPGLRFGLEDEKAQASHDPTMPNASPQEASTQPNTQSDQGRQEGGPATSTTPTLTATEGAQPSPEVSATSATPEETDPAAALLHTLQGDDELLLLTPWDVPVGSGYGRGEELIPTAEQLPGPHLLAHTAWADARSWQADHLNDAIDAKEVTAVVAPVPTEFNGAGNTSSTLLTLVGEQSSRDVGGVVPERGLSLAAAGVDPHGAPLSAVDQRQLLLAHTALLSRQSEEIATQNGAFLAAIERRHPVSAEQLAAVSATIQTSPWAQPASLTQVMDTPGSGANLPVLLASSSDPAVERSKQVRSTVTGLDLLTFPSEAPGAYQAVEEAASMLNSSAWLEADPELDTHFRTDFSHRMDLVVGSVGLNTIPTINLIDSSAQVPLTFHNPLPMPVWVTAQFISHSAHLRIDEVTAKLPPGREITLQVPVQAVGTADVDVDVELHGANGNPLGEPTMLLIRVRADWEKLGYGALLTFGLVLFVIALVRNYLRKRRTGLDEDSTPTENPSGWIPPQPTTDGPQPSWQKLQENDERQEA